MNARILSRAVFLIFSLQFAPQHNDMRMQLNAGTKEERIQQLVALGVEQKTADEALSPIDPVVEWQPIRTESRQQYAILFLPCTVDSAYLYLMKNVGEEWKISDSADFDCHYDNSVSIGISPARESAVDDVLVHHVSEAHGTGVSFQHFKVITVTEGKLKVVLDTEEVVEASHVVPVGRYNLHQQSTFVVIPVVHSHSVVIEETRSTVLNDKLTVSRRRFRWAGNRYVRTRFVPLTADEH